MIVLLLRSVVTYDNMAWSFVIGFYADHLRASELFAIDTRTPQGLASLTTIFGQALQAGLIAGEAQREEEARKATENIMIDYESPHQIVCCIVPTRPSSRCLVYSMITNSVGSGMCSCGLTTKGLGFPILMSSVL
jgi:hypothetical protein